MFGNVWDETVTIMKYRTPDDKYEFKCFDHWNYENEKERVKAMMQEKRLLEEKGYKVLWIKTAVLGERHYVCE